MEIHPGFRVFQPFGVLNFWSTIVNLNWGNAKKTAEPCGCWVYVFGMTWYTQLLWDQHWKTHPVLLGEFSHSQFAKNLRFRESVSCVRHNPHQPNRKNPTTFFPPPCWAKFHHKEHKVDPIHGMDLFSVVPWSEVRCSSWEFYWVRYLSPKKIPGTKTWRYKTTPYFPPFLGKWGFPEP